MLLKALNLQIIDRPIATKLVLHLYTLQTSCGTNTTNDPKDWIGTQGWIVS
jgi:hypothetical protein